MLAMDINDLEIEATLTLNMEDCASYIESYCADHLLAPPKGIYSNSRIEPVMTDGGYYYTIETKDGSVIRNPVSDLGKVKKGLSVYTDINGRESVVVTNLQLQNKERCLSTLPIRPYRGVKIVEQLITNQIDSFIKYRKGAKDLYGGVSGHLNTCTTPEELERLMGVIKEQYADIRMVIQDFMGKHDWNLYFIKFKGGTATIQKSIDWRAYDWMCRMESKEWS
jgi:hypothetical protein